MLKSIWINLNRIAAVFCVCIMAYFFVIGAVLAGALLKSLAGAAIVLVISIPKILFAVANAIVWIVSYAFTHPVDTAFTTLGGIVVLAIVMGHYGFFDESEQVIRRGSRLQAASSVRRRLSGQGQMPSNSEHQAASPLQHRRGSRLATAASNRKPFSPPITWQQKLLGLLGLGRWLSLGNQTNSLSHTPRRTSSTSGHPGRGRRLD